MFNITIFSTFTLLPFYPFTLLRFYAFTLLPFYAFTLLPFYAFTLLRFYFSPIYAFTLLRFYPFTLLRFYPCSTVPLLLFYPLTLLGLPHTQGIEHCVHMSGRYILHTCPNLWFNSCSKCYGMDCFGAYFTHVQTCDVTRVQSATEWTASVHTSHMSKPVM